MKMGIILMQSIEVVTISNCTVSSSMLCLDMPGNDEDPARTKFLLN